MSSMEHAQNAMADFNAAINAAVEGAIGDQPPAAEPQPPVFDDDPPFTDEPPAAEPAPVDDDDPFEPPEEATAQPAERLYAGKYKTVEAMEAAVAHQEEMIQRQSSEVGEVRRLRQELDALRAELAAPAQPAQPAYDERAVTVTQQLVDQGRYQEAAQYTLASNPYLYNAVMEQWAQEAPFAANAFETNRQLQETFQQRVQPSLEAASEVSQRADLNQALDSVMRAHDDFGEIVGSLDEQRLGEIVQNGFPIQVLQGLQGSLQEKQAVFETLYRWVKADRAGELGQAAVRAVETKRAENRQAKAAATVASQTTSPNLERPELTPEQRLQNEIADEWASMIGERNIRAAWTGRR